MYKYKSKIKTKRGATINDIIAVYLLNIKSVDNHSPSATPLVSFANLSRKILPFPFTADKITLIDRNMIIRSDNNGKWQNPCCMLRKVLYKYAA